MCLVVSQELHLPAFQEAVLSLGKWGSQVNLGSYRDKQSDSCDVHSLTVLYVRDFRANISIFLKTQICQHHFPTQDLMIFCKRHEDRHEILQRVPLATKNTQFSLYTLLS